MVKSKKNWQKKGKYPDQSKKGPKDKKGWKKRATRESKKKEFYVEKMVKSKKKSGKNTEKYLEWNKNWLKWGNKVLKKTLHDHKKKQ